MVYERDGFGNVTKVRADDAFGHHPKGAFKVASEAVQELGKVAKGSTAALGARPTPPPFDDIELPRRVYARNVVDHEPA